MATQAEAIESFTEKTSKEKMTMQPSVRPELLVEYGE